MDIDNNNPADDSDNENEAQQQNAAPALRGGLTPDASRLFRICKTLAAMLENRGYNVPRDTKEMTPTTFTQKYGENPSRESLTMLVGKGDDDTDQLFVFFPEDAKEKVSLKAITVITDRMKEEAVTNAILVVKVDLNPYAKQAVQEFSDSFRIEHFKESEMLVDITKHTLVPTHVVLSENQKGDLLKRYRLKETQLPRIQVNDPVARYYGMKRGQVCKIIRPSETAGRYVTYRCCL